MGATILRERLFRNIASGWFRRLRASRLAGLAILVGVVGSMTVSHLDQVTQLHSEIEKLKMRRTERATRPAADPAAAVAMVDPAAVLPTLASAAGEARLRVSSAKQLPAAAAQGRCVQLRAFGIYSDLLRFLDAVAAVSPLLSLDDLVVRRSSGVGSGSVALDLDATFRLHPGRGGSSE